MRLGFKHFNVGKREFCITARRQLDFYGSMTFTLNILPAIEYNHNGSTKSLVFAWMLWELEIEDETYQNMGCSHA